MEQDYTVEISKFIRVILEIDASLSVGINHLLGSTNTQKYNYCVIIIIHSTPLYVIWATVAGHANFSSFTVSCLTELLS